MKFKQIDKKLKETEKFIRRRDSQEEKYYDYQSINIFSINKVQFWGINELTLNHDIDDKTDEIIEDKGFLVVEFMTGDTVEPQVNIAFEDITSIDFRK